MTPWTLLYINSLLPSGNDIDDRDFSIINDNILMTHPDLYSPCSPSISAELCVRRPCLHSPFQISSEKSVTLPNQPCHPLVEARLGADSRTSRTRQTTRSPPRRHYPTTFFISSPPTLIIGRLSHPPPPPPPSSSSEKVGVALSYSEAITGSTAPPQRRHRSLLRGMIAEATGHPLKRKTA